MTELAPTPHSLFTIPVPPSPSKERNFHIRHPKIWLILPILVLTFLTLMVYLTREPNLSSKVAGTTPSSLFNDSSSSSSSRIKEQAGASSEAGNDAPDNAVQSAHTTAVDYESRDTGAFPDVKGQNTDALYVAQEGTIAGIAFHHCHPPDATDDDNTGNSNNDDSPVQSVVLLHGASFTKQVWKSSGILHQLCNHVGGGQTTAAPPSSSSSLKLSVTSLDLPVDATGLQLQQLLDHMVAHSLVSSLPVVLVTPSASGRTVVDWALTQQQQQQAPDTKIPPLSSYISTWIPVASFAVSSIRPPQAIATLFLGVDILAVYGDQDAKGKQAMSLLQQYEAGSHIQVVELPGRHPCYVDSPLEFVSTIVLHLSTL